MREDQLPRLPARTWTWCQWHEGYTATGRLVAVIEQASGPGVSVYACEPCRQLNKLQPWDPTVG